jgi:beta-phosphoglucomutase-like phosphatase (HAD superfamily)
MALPQLVIFDCDGILVDTENIGNRRLAEWLTAAGFPLTFEYCRKNFSGRSMASVHEEVGAAGIDLGADFVERWNDGLPDLFAQGLEEIPHVRHAIETIWGAGIPYCVATSARLTKMRLTLGTTGLLPYFEHAMFSASMVGRGKPFPDLFLYAARTMGFPPAQCVVVEDSVPGVQAAIAAGMKAFAYHGDPHSDREGLAAAGGILFDDMRDLSAMIGLGQSSMLART